MSSRTLVAALLLNTVTGSVLGAQSRSNKFVDFTLGSNFLVSSAPINGQYYRSGQGFGFLSFGNQPDENRPLIVALHLGAFAVLGGNDSCELTPLGGCWKNYPFGGVIAITVGGRPLTAPWSVVELTAGPAFVALMEGGENPFGILTVGRIVVSLRRETPAFRPGLDQRRQGD